MVAASGETPGSMAIRRTRLCGLPTTRMPARAFSRAARLPASASIVDRGYVVPQRIAGGLVLRPSHRQRQTGRERIGLAVPPVVIKTEHHQSVLLNEFLLREKHWIIRADARHARAPSGRRGRRSLSHPSGRKTPVRE